MDRDLQQVASGEADVEEMRSFARCACGSVGAVEHADIWNEERQIAVFENAARHLVPGGRFLVELWVPDLRTLPPGRNGSVFAAQPGYVAADIFDVVAQHVVSHHVTFDPDGGTSARIFRSPHRYIWPAELDLMARIAGFSLESRHGDWSEEPFTAESSDHVSVYRLG